MARVQAGNAQDNSTEHPVTERAVALSPTDPAPPRGMTGEEIASLKAMAADIAAQLSTAEGSDELQVIDSVANLGIQAQRGAATELDLLRARLGEIMVNGGAGAAIANDLTALRRALARINPQADGGPGLLSRLLGGGVLGRGNGSAIGVLERIAIRYEPVSKQIAIIETRLRDGRALLLRDNIELRKLYEAVDTQDLAIQRNAFLGEHLMRELKDIENASEEAAKRERVATAIHDLALRVQDLRTMAEVDSQFFASIDMTRLNNTRLGQAVERTLTLSTNVVMVGLALQVALSRQRRVMEANERTREFLGSVITTNAALMKRHTTEISDAYNNPVIALDKLSQAHNDLLEAMDVAERTRREGITKAEETVTRLLQMSAELKQRPGTLLEQTPASFEAR